jgi:PIN domain nuclease of toxin-antitoxin system
MRLLLDTHTFLWVAARRAISDLQPSTDAGKLDVEEVRVHEKEDTIWQVGSSLSVHKIAVARLVMSLPR